MISLTLSAHPCLARQLQLLHGQEQVCGSIRMTDRENYAVSEGLTGKNYMKALTWIALDNMNALSIDSR